MSRRSASDFVRHNYDQHNDETFGAPSNRSDDWQTVHEDFVNKQSPNVPSQRSSAEPDNSSDSGLSEQLKDLWPSSPPQRSQPNHSIWSSPELPSRASVIGSPSLPTNGQVLTVEQLEQQLTQSNPPAQQGLPPASRGPPPGLPTPPHLMDPRIRMQQQPMRMPRLIRMPHHMGLPHLIPIHPRQQIPPHFLMRPPRGFPHPFPPSFMAPPPQDSPRKSKRSEYLDEMRVDGSGFMTQKEKEWVVRIQLIQLQSADPLREDYYYTNYRRRQQQSSSEPALSLPDIKHQERLYKPVEFSGALGKLTVSSLGAPRRRMDVGVASQEKEGGGRKKQALIIIEKVYPLLFELEELEGESPLPDTRDHLIQQCVNTLLLNTEELTLFGIVLTVSKGKRLITRLLACLPHEESVLVLLGVLHNLPLAVKKGIDKVLPDITSPLVGVVHTLSLGEVVSCLHTVLEWPVGALGKVLSSQLASQLISELLAQGLTRQSPSEEHSSTWATLSAQLTQDLTVLSAQSDLPSSLAQTLSTLPPNP